MSAREGGHLTDAQVNEYVDRVMDEAARAEAEPHVASCAECRDAVNETRAVASRQPPPAGDAYVRSPTTVDTTTVLPASVTAWGTSVSVYDVAWAEPLHIAVPRSTEPCDTNVVP